MTESLNNDYQQLTIMDKLKTGDLILYKDLSEQHVHAATYIDDEIVFTKNGINKFAPYMFQSKSAMENNYFPKQKFKIEVFRHKKHIINSHLYPRSKLKSSKTLCHKNILTNLTK